MDLPSFKDRLKCLSKMCVVLLMEVMGLVLSSGKRAAADLGNKSLRKALRNSIVVTGSIYTKEGRRDGQIKSHNRC